MDAGQNQEACLALVDTKKAWKAFVQLSNIVPRLVLTPSPSLPSVVRTWTGPVKKLGCYLKDNNIKLDIIGDLSVFTPEIQNLAEKTQQLLQNNTGLNLVIAANYGGQWDIVEAAKKIAAKSVNGEIEPEIIDKNVFGGYTALAQYPRVDLLIRTSGEVRVSNFLLWDIAYSELYFCDTLWPDFDTNELDIAIKNFHSRDRRFGERNGEK